MYDNIFLQVQNLRKPTRIKPGGLCSIYVAKKEDVEVWPSQDPQSGVLDQSIQMKFGTTLYLVEATNKERSLKEKVVYGPEGPSVEVTVTASLAGNTINNTLGLAAMLFHKYILICEDMDGIVRLVGNKDGGAIMLWDFDSGSHSGNSRYRNLKWTWLHSLSAPIYLGGPIITDITQIYTQITLLDRFRVDAVDAPMNDGDTIYTNALLEDRNFIMLADGIAIHQLPDNPGQRYCSKPFGSDTITVNGGVSTDEVIEIYLIS